MIEAGVASALTQATTPGDTVCPQATRFQNSVSSPQTPARKALSSSPMQVGCTPLHEPSAWQVLLGEPTRTRGGVHWKDTSDLKVKLLPLNRPSAGVPGSPQNTAAVGTIGKSAVGGLGVRWPANPP